VLAAIGATPAFGTLLTTCVTQTNPSACPAGSSFLVSDNGGQTVTYYSVSETIPTAGSSGTVELGYFSTALNAAASSTAAPVSFNLWSFVGSTTLPYFTGTIGGATGNANATITFTANTSVDSAGTLWIASSANGYAIETNSVTGLQVEVLASQTFNSNSSLGNKQSQITGMIVATSTPEPASYSYLGLGGVGLIFLARRRRKATC
jgi:hypothetical protein